MNKPKKKRGIRKDEKFRKFKELYESGEKLTQMQICEKIGISRDTLNRWVKEIGLKKTKDLDIEKFTLALQTVSASLRGGGHWRNIKMKLILHS